jgi:hypothetical protein
MFGIFTMKSLLTMLPYSKAHQYTLAKTANHYKTLYQLFSDLPQNINKELSRSRYLKKYLSKNTSK